jgi:ABC-type multidrug transport system fused ATPase/permease subunit
MRPVLRLIRFTARFFVPCVVFATVLYCGLPLGLGLATRAVFDRLSAGGQGALAVVGVVVVLQLGEVLTDLAIGRAWSGFSYQTHTLLQRNLFVGLFRGYGRHGLPVPVGDALGRFREDPPSITSGSMDGVCDLVGRALFAVVAVVVMVRIDPLLTAAAFAPVLVAAVVSDALGSRSSRYGAAALASTTSLTRFLGELLGAHLAVRIAGAEGRVVAHLEAIGEERRRSSLRDRVFAETLNSMNFHLVHVSTGAVLLLGAGRLRSGAFTVGDLALFIVFLEQLQFLPAEVGRVITEVKRTAVSIDRMHALIPGERREDVVSPARIHLREPLPPLPPRPGRERLDLLEVDGLTSIHPSSGRGVEDVSFALRRGTVTVVTGRVGAGKSTLLHAVLGLLPTDAGSIRWNGAVVADPSTFFVPPRSAFTPQVPHLCSTSLRENLLLGRADDEVALARAVRGAVLEDDVRALGRGLDTLVGSRGVKLSGGQVQRAAAARMFVGRPELLVFDDLSSALDATTEAELWRRLFDADEGDDGDEVEDEARTCLVVSHRPIALARADQVLVLEDGRLRAG